MEHGAVLPDHAIRERLRAHPPLLEDLRDVDAQIQSCGVDLTVRAIARYTSAGAVDFDNTRRSLAEKEPVEWKNGVAALEPGAYHIIYNEKVNLPADLMALVYPRSSLMRCGVTLHTAVWDPGYSGRGEALMIVYNSCGFHLYRDARVGQLVFTRVGGDVQRVYDGRFHGENE